MPIYIAPEHKALLEYNHLNGFDELWNFKVDWVEPSNQDRGGWSGVGRITLKQPQGGELKAYLKRQQNHTRRTWLHQLVGEPTFRREFQIISHLRAMRVGTPQPMLYLEDDTDGSSRAILVTEELAGYRSLDQVTEHWPTANAISLWERRRLLKALAGTIRAMHDVYVHHRSLYPKHLFIKEVGDDFHVVLLDFEKSRLSYWPVFRMVADLSKLNYRTNNFSRTDRLYFFKQYYQIERFGFWNKFILKYIHKKSKIKSKAKINLQKDRQC